MDARNNSLKGSGWLTDTINLVNPLPIYKANNNTYKINPELFINIMDKIMAHLDEEFFNRYEVINEVIQNIEFHNTLADDEEAFDYDTYDYVTESEKLKTLEENLYFHLNRQLQIIKQIQKDVDEFELNINEFNILNERRRHPKLMELRKQIENNLFQLSLSFDKEVFDYKMDFAKQPLYQEKFNTEVTKETVLNRNNPFADITIESQRYLIKNESGELKMLQFSKTHELSYLETPEHHGLILKPTFKVQNYNPTLREISSITLDDSISKELPKDLGDNIQIYYF